MVGTIGVAARVFGALAEAGVNITMISQGSSEANISIVVEGSHLNIAADAIRSEFRNGVVRELTMNPDVSAVAVIGAGMVGTPGIAARVFTAMGGAGINVIMISQDLQSTTSRLWCEVMRQRRLCVRCIMSSGLGCRDREWLSPIYTRITDYFRAKPEILCDA